MDGKLALVAVNLTIYMAAITAHLPPTFGSFSQLLIQYWMIDFQGGFAIFFVSVYTLAMASTALAVLLGCAVEDPKLGQEMLPLLFVPQMLFGTLSFENFQCKTTSCCD